MMKMRFFITMAVLVLVVFTGGFTAIAQENPSDLNIPPVPSLTDFKKAHAVLAGDTGDALAGNQEMFNYISDLVNQTKNMPGVSNVTAANLQFGKPYSQIGTFDKWTMWIGWNGSFSDSYVPESETYAWVVYFAPEGVYVALQEAKSVYSGVNVFGSIGYFMGTMISPDGAILKKDYIKSLCGVALTWGWGFNGMPVGPLVNSGVSLDTGATFFRVCNAKQLARGFQYNTGYSVALNLLASLPLSVSLDTSSDINGFYPIIDWSDMPTTGGTPIDIVAQRLQLIASQPGNNFLSVMANQFAKTLLPFFSRLRVPEPVTLKNTDLPTTGELFKQFLQNNRTTIPATSPKPTIDHFIGSVQTWLKTGNTNELSDDIKRSSQILTDPPELFKKLGAGTGLAFEMAYKHAADYYKYSWNYCDSVKNITCEIGKTCSVSVTASEIAALVPGSSAADFEGTTVWFNNPSDEFLASGYDWTEVPVKNGKAVFKFIQNSSASVLIGPEVSKSALTNNKTLKLCRRVIQLPSTLPVVTISAVDPSASENGDKGRFVIKRTGDTSNDLIVKYEVGGSATRGKDYKSFGLFKKIPAGSASVGISVVPIADTIAEPVETVMVRLSNDETYTVGTNSKATVYIEDAP